MNSQTHPLLLTPHRGFFLLGILVFVLSMAWWTAALVNPPTLLMPMSWLHAWLAMFGMLGPFISGFLFTAYSRWLGADPPSRVCWMSSLGLSVAGVLLFFSGAWAGLTWSLAGALCWLAAWLLIFGHLARAAIRGGGALLHAASMMAAVALGLAAAGLLVAWLLGGNSLRASQGLAVAFWGFLLSVYLVVAHRMIPFFAGRVLQPYPAYRPAWALLLALGLAWTHLSLLLAGQPEYLWAPDAGLAVLTGWLGWRWQWWRAGAHRLLAALFIAWLGLVAGLAASAIQHGYLFATGEWLALRLPEHLIGIGFFAGMIIAMGTRVTLGHSGRPLQMGPVAWWSLLGIGGSALLRGLAEFLPLREELMLASALLWVAAGLAWALRHAPMLILPRADRRPG
jgi:uncharacterized protein involved in response to NO